MAWPSDRKQKTRQQILQSAAALFTANGFDAVSITDVMKHAGLTHGAFYAHFASKTELYQHAIYTAGELSAHAHGLYQRDLRDAVHSYLSVQHSCQRMPACPLAYLVTDVAAKDQAVQSAYSDVFQGFVKLLAEPRQGTTTTQPAALAALMIGGLAIARTMPDPTQAQTLLDACRSAADLLLANQSTEQSC